MVWWWGAGVGSNPISEALRQVRSICSRFGSLCILHSEDTGRCGKVTHVGHDLRRLRWGRRSGVQAVGQCNCGLGDARRKTGRYDLTFELIAVASMTVTGPWYLNFWIWSVHVSTWIEVDTMVLKILDHSKMT